MLLNALEVAGKNGRWVLPLGLLAAMLLPAAASAMQVLVGPMLGLLLLVSFLQTQQNSASTSGSSDSWSSDLKQFGPLLICMQLLLPIALLLAMRLVGITEHWQVTFALVAAASCITGGPSIVMMLGGNGARAIRLLIVSTLALPITAIPVLAMLPLHASSALLLRTSLVLALVILGAFYVAKLLQQYVLAEYSTQQRLYLDGVSAILLALLVLGLMSAIHTAWDKPVLLLTTLLWACVVNVVLQCFGVLLNTLFLLKVPIMLGVMSGNRSVAIFLTALPESTSQPYLLFIACYQIPMYLTPLLGGYVYRRYSDNGS